jgi:hypothetical protein
MKSEEESGETVAGYGCKEFEKAKRRKVLTL